MEQTVEHNATLALTSTLSARAPSRWRRLRPLIRNRASLAGLIIVVVLAVLALVAPLIAPFSPIAVHIRDKVQAPNGTYLLGTDQFGRDILSRLLYGARISLTLSVVSVLIAGVIGMLIGATAGYSRPGIDELIMRLIDIVMAFPYIVLAIAMMAVVGPSLRNIAFVIAFTRIPQFARLARGSVLTLKNVEYITAARAIGLPGWRIVFRHMIPNILTPLIVLASLSIATAILTESSLSFLGLGVQPPTASWGTMIADGENYMSDGFWISTVPGIAISIAILGFNLLGDGLRDVLDPRTRAQL